MREWRNAADAPSPACAGKGRPCQRLAQRGSPVREPLFIVIAIGVTITPNIMWYHHWVFLLLPLMVWMAWARLSPAVVGWCLLGLMVMQYDRWQAPYGLWVHLHCHLSLWLVLAMQFRQLHALAADAPFQHSATIPPLRGSRR